MSRKAKKASRHHHTVPKFHLRGFADEDRMLRQIDLETGRQTTLCITDATVRRDFYTLRLPDGSRSDMWERRLAAVENEVAPMLRAATRAESREAKGQQRAALSLWMGLQLLRGQGQRSQLSQIQALMMRMTVGMGGLAYLQHAMSEGLGRPVPLEEAEVVWEDVHKPGARQFKLPALTTCQRCGRRSDRPCRTFTAAHGIESALLTSRWRSTTAPWRSSQMKGTRGCLASD